MRVKDKQEQFCMICLLIAAMIIVLTAHSCTKETVPQPAASFSPAQKKELVDAYWDRSAMRLFR